MTTKAPYAAQQQQVIRQLFLFRGLTQAQIASALDACPPPVTVAKGGLLNAGQRSRTLCVLLSGEANVFRRGSDHCPVLLRRLGAGDICGAAALFGGDEAVTEVVAQKPCTLLCLPESAVLTMIHHYPMAAENYIRFLSDRVRFLNRRIVQLTGGQTENRVLNNLRLYADEDGIVRLPYGLSQLALRLGMSRSSLYRALDALQAEGLLITENGQRRLLL